MFHRIFFILLLFVSAHVIAGTPIINAFSPSSGAIGTLVVVNGSDLTGITTIGIGNTPGIVTSNTGSKITFMIMPGSVTGPVILNSSGTIIRSNTNFNVTDTQYPYEQQGGRFVGSPVGYYPREISNNGENQGLAVAISADGNTMASGSPNDYPNGAVYVFTRSNGTWRQEAKITETPSTGPKLYFGHALSMSADGNTLLIGSPNQISLGPSFLYVRNNGVWSKQALLDSPESSSPVAKSVALSADGNTAAINADSKITPNGSVWIFTRTGTTWTRQSEIIPAARKGDVNDGWSVVLSGDGNTLLIGKSSADSFNGITEVFVRSENKWVSQGVLYGNDAVGAASQGVSLALSADGNVAIIGGTSDDHSKGAAWIFKRTNGLWAQQGSKLVPAIRTDLPVDYNYSSFGKSVGISADGGTVLVSCLSDHGVNGDDINTIRVYKQINDVWTQQADPFFASPSSMQTFSSLALSADGSTAVLGAPEDPGGNVGAVNVFVPAADVVVGSFTPKTAVAGTVININGENLDKTSSVTFGGTPATLFTINSANSITATVAANTGNLTSVEVKSHSKSSILQGFHFIPVPVINIISYLDDGKAAMQIYYLYGASYQWFKDGVAISNNNDPNYIAAQAGVYSVKVSLGGLSQISQPLTYVPRYSLPVTNFSVSTNSVTCKGSNNGSITVTATKILNYTATLSSGTSNKQSSFTSTTSFTGLAPGSYSLCITVDGQITYQQCYSLIIIEPKDLSVYSVVSAGQKNVNLELSGGTTYHIQLNGARITTTAPKITLPLVGGTNKLIVTTDWACQGIIEKSIIVSGEVLVFPDPFQNELYVNLGYNEVKTATVKIYDLFGKPVYQNQFSNPESILRLDISNIKNIGIYSMQLVTDDITKIFKIIKK